ncbi:MAG: FHA domain-containing protein [Myxococcota bacterium]
MKEETGTDPGSCPVLQVKEGLGAGMLIELRQPRLVLGRRKADVVLNDPEISGQHAEFLWDGLVLRVRDMGSTNGTFVNEKQIQEQALSTGDLVTIGRTALLITLPTLGGGVELPLSSAVPTRPHIPLGIYEGLSWTRTVSAEVEDRALPDSELAGTEVFDTQTPEFKLLLAPQTVLQLEFLAGPEKGRVVSLTQGNLELGRQDTVVVVADKDVSRRHVAIDCYGRDQIFLRDLGSTNGSYLNGEREGFARIQSGDTLVLGKNVLQVLIKELHR